MSVSAPEGVTPESWQDWLAARKAKRLCKPTKAVLARVEREAAKAGLTIAQAIQTAAERGWGGFEADWLSTSERPSNVGPHSTSTKIGDYVRKPKQRSAVP